MRILLDTHCWIWLTAAPERFSPRLLKELESVDTVRLLSSASAWEIALKSALGKLRLPLRPLEYLSTYLHQTRTTALPITIEHAAYVADLPNHHRDPIDRLLVAQAMLEGLPILTTDSQIRRYDVDVIDAV